MGAVVGPSPLAVLPRCKIVEHGRPAQAMDSAEVTMLAKEAIVTVAEFVLLPGTVITRCRLTAPVEGWLSLKTVEQWEGNE